MTVDVACTGRVYLDLTFAGLEALPRPGEERFARDLLATPGGAAITAISLVRLGLSAAVVAPLGRDLAGELVRRRLGQAGVVCAGATGGRTPVTVVLPADGDRALATFEPSVRVERAAVERLRPRAVVASLDRLDVAPAGAALYAGAGQRDAERCAGRLPAGLAAARALLVNRVEARLLTGEADPSDAALALAETVRTAVVTCGAEGAVAAAGGALTTAAAPAVHAIDTTGAGDVFVAAYVWGDLEGLPLEERLRRAAVVAALSVRTSTGAGGAPTREELEHFLADEQSAMVNE